MDQNESGKEDLQRKTAKMNKTNPISEPAKIPEDCAVVACGILRREMLHLGETGFLSRDRLFFTAPGLHEWPEKLKEQLPRQLEKARGVADRVIVAYGEKCYLDTETGMDTDDLLARFGGGVERVRAKNCVDMLTGAEERNRLAKDAKVYWLTPGWVEYWDFIFKDWDAAKANETFPGNDRVILLDAVGYYDNLSQTDPERILRICDWIKLPLEPHSISLERLKDLLLQCAQGPAISGAESSKPQSAGGDLE